MSRLMLRAAVRLHRPTYYACCGLVAAHPVLHPLEHWIGLPLDSVMAYATAYVMTNQGEV